MLYVIYKCKAMLCYMQYKTSVVFLIISAYPDHKAAESCVVLWCKDQQKVKKYKIQKW